MELESRWAVRTQDLLQALNEVKPRVVHFSGHGSEAEELILEDDMGNSKPVSKEAITHFMPWGPTMSGSCSSTPAIREPRPRRLPST